MGFHGNVISIKGKHTIQLTLKDSSHTAKKGSRQLKEKFTVEISHDERQTEVKFRTHRTIISFTQKKIVRYFMLPED